MKQHTRPLLIQAKEGIKTSVLMSKFKNYLPVLASLSSQVRVIYNKDNDSIEVHGTPESKSSVLQFFTEIEEALTSSNSNFNVDVMQAATLSTYMRTDYYPGLWKYLYDKAASFTVSHCNNLKVPLQFHTLRINPALERGCPAAKKFISGITSLNLNPNDHKTIYQNGVPFGWHGTRNVQAVIGITHNNLLPSLRSGQAYGPGEYCAVGADYSQRCWGNTNTLFVFFIVKCKYYKFSTHHVVNNPLDGGLMFMVPILIATFGTQTPLDLGATQNNNVKWEWMDDSEWVEYGRGQSFQDTSQIILEESYQKYCRGTGLPSITLAFTRLNDRNVNNYRIDFSKLQQINSCTNYIRKIRRTQ